MDSGAYCLKHKVNVGGLVTAEYYPKGIPLSAEPVNNPEWNALK